MKKSNHLKNIHWNKNTHLEYSVLLSYFDGMLNEGTCMAINLHLEECISCQAKVQEVEILLSEHNGDVESLRRQLEENALSSLAALKESDVFDLQNKGGRILPIRRIKFASGIAAGFLLFFAVKFFNNAHSFDASYVPIALHVNPNPIDGSRSEDDLFNLAVDKYINNELDLAKDLFSEVCKSDVYTGDAGLVSYAKAYLGIINLQLDPANRELTKENFLEAYNLGNDSIKAIASFFIGNIAYNAGDFHKAKEYFNALENNKLYLQLTEKEEKIFTKMLSKLK